MSILLSSYHLVFLADILVGLMDGNATFWYGINCFWKRRVPSLHFCQKVIFNIFDFFFYFATTNRKIFKNTTYVCVRIKRYHVVDHRKGDIDQNRKKSQKCRKCKEGTLLFQKQLIPYQNVAFPSIRPTRISAKNTRW